MSVSQAHSLQNKASIPEGELGCPLLSQSILNIDDKCRSNPLTWKGQFSPQLVEAHLRLYAKPGDRILDPFLGSGTVLLEGLRRGTHPVGVEINPAAVTLARLYAAAGFSQQQRTEALTKVDKAIGACARASTGSGPLFPGDGVDTSTALRTLLSTFPRPSLELDLFEALVVACDIHQKLEWKTVMARWRDLHILVSTLPFVPVPPKVFLADARRLPVVDSSFDLILTSPPYINVFNYHQQYRASAEAVGWDILPIARSEIGSNRKFRGNRLITVAQYCLDMALCLLEVRRTLSPSGRAIFVVGRESNVRKTPFYNASILKALATLAGGLEIVLQQERAFQNRFGVKIYEDILHLTPSQHTNTPVLSDVISAAREIAVRVLSEALTGASEIDIRVDLEDAISKAASVDPSPILSLTGQANLASVLHTSV